MTENQTRLKTLLEAINTDSVQSFKVRHFNEWTTTYIRKDGYKFAHMKLTWVPYEWETQSKWDDGSEAKGTDYTEVLKLHIGWVLDGTNPDSYFTLVEMHLKF